MWNQARWHTAVNLALRRLRQNCEFKASLGYMARPCQKRKRERDIGKERGRERGRKEGSEEGREEGRKEGRKGGERKK
jgi:flagellar biosynthesis/type III secretory pathway protein FliH